MGGGKGDSETNPVFLFDDEQQTALRNQLLPKVQESVGGLFPGAEGVKRANDVAMQGSLGALNAVRQGAATSAGERASQGNITGGVREQLIQSATQPIDQQKGDVVREFKAREPLLEMQTLLQGISGLDSLLGVKGARSKSKQKSIKIF